MGDSSEIIRQVASDDPAAAEAVLPLVYDQLRRLADREMASEPSGATLQPTALVHEAYLRLVDGGAAKWNSRGHFFAAAAEAMRRILIEIARRKRSLRGGGGHRRVEMEPAATHLPHSPDDLLALDEALAEFAREEPAKAELVKLRFFALYSRRWRGL